MPPIEASVAAAASTPTCAVLARMTSASSRGVAGCMSQTPEPNTNADINRRR